MAVGHWSFLYLVASDFEIFNELIVSGWKGVAFGETIDLSLYQ